MHVVVDGPPPCRVMSRDRDGCPSGGRFCSSGSTWYRTEPRSDGNPPPSYGDRDLHHGPAGDRCLQLEIAVSSRGWLESPSPFLLYVLTKTFRDVYTYICQPNVVVKWASHPSAASAKGTTYSECHPYSPLSDDAAHFAAMRRQALEWLALVGKGRDGTQSSAVHCHVSQITEVHRVEFARHEGAPPCIVNPGKELSAF